MQAFMFNNSFCDGGENMSDIIYHVFVGKTQNTKP
jgi:hypothetical protein